MAGGPRKKAGATWPLRGTDIPNTIPAILSEDYLIPPPKAGALKIAVSDATDYNGVTAADIAHRIDIESYLKPPTHGRQRLRSLLENGLLHFKVAEGQSE